MHISQLFVVSLQIFDLQFSSLQMIGDKLNKLLRTKKTSEDEKTRLKLYYKEIREIFDTQKTIKHHQIF